MKAKVIIMAGLVLPLLAAGCTKATDSTSSVESSSQVQAVNPTPTEKSDSAMMMDSSHVLGVVMTKGKLFTVGENNELSELKGDLTLKNGTKVTAAGAITASNGSLITLKDGQELSATDGSMMTPDLTKMMMAKDDSGDAMQKAEPTDAMSHDGDSMKK